jgi:membrane-associated PAP2 superfamily phosphatase
MVTIVWFSAYFAARLLLKMDVFAPWERVAISLLPIPFFAWFVMVFIRQMRDTDEMQRRIQLEALAIAFPLSVLLLMTLGLLQKAIVLSENDWGYTQVWLYLPLFYAFGNAIAAHRYR